MSSGAKDVWESSSSECSMLKGAKKKRLSLKATQGCISGNQILSLTLQHPNKVQSSFQRESDPDTEI